MAVSRESSLTLEDLFDLPDDGLRRELLDGKLYVSPHPGLRHQAVVLAITLAIHGWVRVYGGKVYPGANVDPAPGEHVEPDVVFLSPNYDGGADDLSVLGAPSLVVEVLSPGNKHYDLTVKRDWYERRGVPEYWAADLDTDEIIVFRIRADGHYGEPQRYARGETFTSPQLPGVTLAVDDLLPS